VHKTKRVMAIRNKRKKRKRRKKVVVSTQIAKLKQIVYESGIPAWLINVEELFDSSLPYEENERIVRDEIEELKRTLKN